MTVKDKSLHLLRFYLHSDGVKLVAIFKKTKVLAVENENFLITENQNWLILANIIIISILNFSILYSMSWNTNLIICSLDSGL